MKKYKKILSWFLLVAVCIFAYNVIVLALDGTIIRGTFSWPTQIDPAVGVDNSSSKAITNLYDTLVYPTYQGGVIPHLAKSWEISEDGTTYIFRLNKRVKFHDGSELDAEDIKFSFKRLITIGQGYAYIFKGRVKEVNVLDNYTVQFKLKEPFGPFLSTLIRFYVVNKDNVMAHIKEGKYGEYGDYGIEWLNTHDAGTGAYKVKEFDVGSYLLMEKYNDYFGEIREHAPDYFKMVGTTDAVTVKTLIKNRELEISDQWQTKESFESLLKIKGVKMASWPDGGEFYLMMNTKKAPLDDIHVRKAIACIFDYGVVTKQIFVGTKQSVGPVSQAIPGWKKVYQYKNNFEKAKEELQKSKYYGQFDQYPIEFAWTAEVPDQEKVALMLMFNAKKVGLNMEIQKTPWMKMIDKAAKVETTPHIMSVFVNPHYPEAGSTLKTKYHSATAGSWEQVEWLQNNEIDNLIEKSLSEINRKKRMLLYGEIQEKIVELCPSLFCFDNVEKHAYQAEYIDWPRSERPIPVLGYNYDMRFIEIHPELRQKLLK